MRKEKYISERKGKYGITLQVKVPYKTETGRSHLTESVRVIDYPTPKQALEVAKIKRDELLRNVRLGKVKHTPFVCELYEESLKIMPFSIKTVERHDSIYNNSIKSSSVEFVQIDKLTPAMLQENVNHYAETHSQSMVNHLVSIWRQIFKTANMLNIPTVDLTLSIMIPKSKVHSRKREVIISREDFEKFMGILYQESLVNYDKRALYYAIILMSETGLRPSECFALTRDSFQDSLIVVNKAVGSTRQNKNQIITTKTSESERYVPISSNLKPIIDDVLKLNNFHLVFGNKQGKPYDLSLIHI